MTHDTLIGYVILSFCGTALLSWLLTLWRDSKRKTSIHAADTSLDDVALSALSSIGFGKGRLRKDGMMELRPPIGLRIIAPAIATVFLLKTDFSPLLESFGLRDPGLQSWAVTGLLVILGLAVLQLNFAQSLAYDQTRIECKGVQMKPQTRDLSGLVDIAVHPKRPALVLTFADQERLYVPKFLNGRAGFVGSMRVIAAENRSRGLEAPRQGLLAQMGF